MKIIYLVLSGILFFSGKSNAQAPEKTVVIQTNVGTMKIKLYNDVPNHTAEFLKRVNEGKFNGTLFTRVIKEFMIQGGATDSKDARPGARCGFGDKYSEILPELQQHYFHKKGVLAAPRHPDDVNPQKKSDMSQFFIVHGKLYRPGELDTLEMVKNIPIKKKAMQELYAPVKLEMEILRKENPREYNKKAQRINAQVDSVVRATPGHLIFTEEQRKAYTTIGGCHHLDGIYTIFGEVTEGLDIIDIIANQAKDSFDRPKKDIRITSISVEN